MEILNRAFYKRHPVFVAKALLGKLLVRKINGKILSGMIVETEAYGSDDPASHSFRGMTERNKPMFGEVGKSYVYFTYGNHFCLNVVAKDTEPAGAVLIRAIEPVDVIGLMKKFRKTDDLFNLTSGPGKLTKALKIDKSLNEVDMTRNGELFIAENSSKDFDIETSKRIGISSGEDKMWRFIIKGNKFVSK